jgi:uncharacterized protein YchJ
VLWALSPRGRAGADRGAAHAFAVQCFCVSDEGYLLRTWHPATRPPHVGFDKGLRWQHLDVLGSTRDGLRETVPPVRHEVMVKAAPERAFKVFTAGFGTATSEQPV